VTSTSFASRDASWGERGSTFTVFLALGISVGAWAAALPGLKLSLDLSDRDLSLALLAVSVGSVMATLAAGALAPRIGTGRSTTGASLALAVAMALPAFAGTLWTLVALSLVFGVANGFLDVSMNGHASEVERRWGTAIMSSFHGAFSLGGLTGAALGGVIAGAGFGPVGQLTIPAALVATLVIGAALGLGPGSRSEPHEAGLAWPVRAAWGLCAVALFCLMVEGAMADWSAVYLATVVKVSQGAAASGYAAFSIAMTIGRLTGDRIVRRFGARPVVIGGGGIAAIGLATSVLFAAFVPATAGFLLVGLGLSNIAPTVFSAAGRFGRTPAAGMAMVVSVGYIGFISGPPLIGAVASLTDLRFAIGCLVAVAVGVVVSGFWMRTAPDA
jgi:MFS family permease